MALHFGILGFPVAHSLSPDFFRAKFQKYGIDAQYHRFEVKPEELASFLRKVREGNIRGLSVTLPYKVKILEFLDEVDEEAKMIGAVNTVLNDGGRLKGFNTDAGAFLRVLEEMSGGLRFFEGKKMVIIGAGGAAAAVISACLQAMDVSGHRNSGGTSKGTKVTPFLTVLNRTPEKAQVLAKRFGIQSGKLEDLFRFPADILIQTTPVGMEPSIEHSPVPKAYFEKYRGKSNAGFESKNLLDAPVAIDILYTPLKTRLLKDAVAAGWRTISGEKMFQYQAEKQWEIWFQKDKK